MAVGSDPIESRTLITRHLQEEQRDERRREQRQADEHSLRGVIARRRG
jgi:flagellar biosynthesis chaperone FliJ